MAQKKRAGGGAELTPKVEPLPCPFCKNDVLEGDTPPRRYWHSGAETFHFIECPRCGARGPSMRKVEGDYIKAWNRVATRFKAHKVKVSLAKDLTA